MAERKGPFMLISVLWEKCRKLTLPALVALNLLLTAMVLFPASPGLGTDPADARKPLEPVEVQLPILMYHDVLQNPKKIYPYVIAPAQLEQDLLYLRDNGYQTVVTQDLVDFVEQGKPLPEKPIMLTFDDGYFNNVYYAEPLLKKYGMRAVMFVVGTFCERAVKEGEENPNYSYIQWDRLADMAKGDVWEIQSHSWNMHQSNGNRMGVQRRAHQTVSQYIDALRTDFTLINDKLKEVTGKEPIAFAYPFGAIDDQVEDVLKEMGYKVTVGSTQGRSTLVAGRPETLHMLKRLARLNDRPARWLLVQ
jgi:peptidoglycan/xylan/chitin deacetylase (PgdA/CDA1 family)